MYAATDAGIIKKMLAAVITEQAEGHKSPSVLSSFEKEKTGTSGSRQRGRVEYQSRKQHSAFSFIADSKTILEEEDHGQTGYL